MPVTRPNEDRRALVALLRAWGNDARTRDGLLTAGSAAATLDAARRATGPREDRAAGSLEGDLAWLEGPSRHLVSVLDPDFPPLLRESPLAPAALWIEGDPTALWAPQIAIVGARQATAAGRANARAFASALARAGLTVTSGLADGIDAEAHAAALDAGAPTIAVFGTGLRTVYPARQATLAARIAECGALVSEFPPASGPRPAHFPRRNRIIAGLALGTLVVEAGLRSGSLGTARLAVEQGREVFAIPGPIHHPLARGCHRLIRDGALLVEDANEVLAALAPLARRLGCAIAARLGDDTSAPPEDDVPRRGGDAGRVLGALAGGTADVDALVAMTGLEAARIAAALVLLELDGCVARGPGGAWMRLPNTGPRMPANRRASEVS
jgi:DNA processing protein